MAGWMAGCTAGSAARDPRWLSLMSPPAPFPRPAGTRAAAALANQKVWEEKTKLCGSVEKAENVSAVSSKVPLDCLVSEEQLRRRGVAKRVTSSSTPSSSVHFLLLLIYRICSHVVETEWL